MRKKKIAVLAAAAALTLGTVFSSYATSKAIEDAKKKVSSMEEEKKKVESTLKELEGKKSDTAAYVKELSKSVRPGRGAYKAGGRYFPEGRADRGSKSGAGNSQNYGEPPV